MSSMGKKIQANEDKKFLLRKTGKTPKHRCPVCHRFTMWFTARDGKTKNCYWCVEESQNKLLKKVNSIPKKVKKYGI